MKVVPLTDMDKQIYIRTFLLEWMGWVDHGANEPHFHFNRGEGLCKLLTKWLRRKGFNNMDISSISHFFWHELGKNHVPFNRTKYTNPDQLTYMEEFERYCMHENKLRWKWATEYVRKRP